MTSLYLPRRYAHYTNAHIIVNYVVGERCKIWYLTKRPGEYLKVKEYYILCAKPFAIRQLGRVRLRARRTRSAKTEH